MTAYLGWRKRFDRLEPEICIGGNGRMPPVLSIAAAGQDDLVSLQVIPRDIDLLALNLMSRERLAHLFPPPQPEPIND